MRQATTPQLWSRAVFVMAAERSVDAVVVNVSVTAAFINALTRQLTIAKFEAPATPPQACASMGPKLHAATVGEGQHKRSSSKCVGKPTCPPVTSQTARSVARGSCHHELAGWA